ncbi:MAG: hypothetical protein MMC33_006040 [Icmadophila ericetorum]|nr:hypothetical protein [Icmadophila ericetorum]
MASQAINSNTILHSLLSTSTTEENTSPQYKFIVTSTIIQHAPPKPSATSSSSTSTSTSTAAITTLEATPLEDAKSESTPTTTAPAVSEPAATSAAGSSGGKRGMHSATGAYWNSEKDGMWSFKWDGGERGFDVVVSVVWVGV